MLVPTAVVARPFGPRFLNRPGRCVSVLRAAPPSRPAWSRRSAVPRAGAFGPRFGRLAPRARLAWCGLARPWGSGAPPALRLRGFRGPPGSGWGLAPLRCGGRGCPPGGCPLSRLWWPAPAFSWARPPPRGGPGPPGPAGPGGGSRRPRAPGGGGGCVRRGLSAPWGPGSPAPPRPAAPVGGSGVRKADCGLQSVNCKPGFSSALGGPVRAGPVTRARPGGSVRSSAWGPGGRGYQGVGQPGLSRYTIRVTSRRACGRITLARPFPGPR